MSHYIPMGFTELTYGVHQAGNKLNELTPAPASVILG